MGKISPGERKAEKEEAKEIMSGPSRFNDDVIRFFRKEMDIDIIEEFKLLKAVGELPADQLMDRMALAKEINSAAGRSRRAHLIFLKARRERELFRISHSRKMESLTSRAIKKVEEWLKDNEVTKKQITKDMIDQKICSDDELSKEYTELIDQEEELKAIQDDCQTLAMEWSERKRTLQTQARLITAEKEAVFGKE